MWLKMKFELAIFVAALCILNCLVEGKWRPEHNQRQEVYEKLGENNEGTRKNYADVHATKEKYHENDRKHDKRNSFENNYNKKDYDSVKHYENRKYEKYQNNWTRRETANEISTGRPQHNFVDPPDHTKLIPMARYVLHNSDWASIATISTLPAIEGFPFSNVKSVVDGSVANSTGVPYFYMSPLDFTAKDLTKNTRSTVLVSLEETRYCEKQKIDPEDPRCTRLMLSGKMKKVKPDTPEYVFAKAALFERHPAMADFPPDHDWFVAKLKIAQIAMVDWFGGAKYIPVREYLAYNYTNSYMPSPNKQDISKL